MNRNRVALGGGRASAPAPRAGHPPEARAPFQGGAAWRAGLEASWQKIHFHRFKAQSIDDGRSLEVHVDLGGVDPAAVRVGLCADAVGDRPVVRAPMERDSAVLGPVHGHAYRLALATDRPADHFTPRVVPAHAEARVPAEAPLIAWQR